MHVELKAMIMKIKRRRPPKEHMLEKERFEYHLHV